MRFTALLCSVFLLGVSADVAAQRQAPPEPKESEEEIRARMARRAAGLTVGHWELRGVEPATGVEASTMPMITAFWRRGLDARLALENGVGVWRRVQRSPEQGGVLGGPAEEVHSWVISQTTGIRFYPVTDAGARVEPWVLGAAGITLGIDDRETRSAGPLGSAAGGSGVAIVPGFSLQAGAGAEWWFAQHLAANVGARFQWTRFLQAFGGERTYQGPLLEAGLTYKFQYR